jgi:hypothetical protein
MIRAWVSAAVVAGVMLVGTEVRATPIAYCFTGTVTGVGSSLGGAFSAGDTFSGTFMFDDQAGMIDYYSVEYPLLDDYGHKYGTYSAQDASYASPMQGVSGTLGGTYSFGSQMDLDIAHTDYPGGGNDFWQLRSQPNGLNGSAVNGLLPAHLGLFFGSSTDNVIGSTALSAPLFNDWPVNGFYLSFNPDAIDMGGHGETVVGSLTSFAAVSVPEPSSWVLVGFGAVGLMAMKRGNLQRRPIYLETPGSRLPL